VLQNKVHDDELVPLLIPRQGRELRLISRSLTVLWVANMSMAITDNAGYAPPACLIILVSKDRERVGSREANALIANSVRRRRSRLPVRVLFKSRDRGVGVKMTYLL